MRPKGAFDCRYDPRGGYYTVKSLREPQGGQRLLLKIARAGAAPVMPTAPQGSPAVWQSRAGAIPIDLTAVPAASHKPADRPGESDATYAPVSQQRVSLVALALPRLSRYRDTGAQALELPFDHTLSLSAEAKPAIVLTADANDQLYACTAEGRQRVEAPATFAPLDSRTLRLLPAAPEMADRYRALVCLAQPLSTGVASGARFTFGRNSAMLASLRLLDSPRFLKRGEGASTASADRIGLSRNAFSFEATGKGYTIGRLSPTQALYHLDDKLQFIASIGDAPYLLPHGHHLAAGHYVLRFEA